MRDPGYLYEYLIKYPGFLFIYTNVGRVFDSAAGGEGWWADQLVVPGGIPTPGSGSNAPPPPCCSALGASGFRVDCMYDFRGCAPGDGPNPRRPWGASI